MVEPMLEINMKEHFQKLLGGISAKALVKSVMDCHVKGLFSLVISGEENGNLTRAFMASKKIRYSQNQLHNHRYKLRLTVLRGDVRQIVAVPDSMGEQSAALFEYRSKLNGGEGLKYLKEMSFNTIETVIPLGSTLVLDNDVIHSISCSKDAVWVIEEFGFRTDHSLVLGLPFHTDGLYNEPLQHQITDKCDELIRILRKILLDFDTNG